MSIVEKKTGTAVTVGEPDGYVYSFDTPAGEYVLTAYAPDGETIRGSIVLEVEEQEDEQVFPIFTCTAYATNKNEDGSLWSIAKGDYMIDCQVVTREGKPIDITIGNGSTDDKKTILVFSGNTLNIQYIPGKEKVKEGYLTTELSGTITFNRNITGEIYQGYEYLVTVPSEAEFFLGTKRSHFVDFKITEPRETEINGENKTISYFISKGNSYNFRTWINGQLTIAGTGTPESFTAEDYKAYNPKQINHDPTSNNGYETGDIFVNINPQGHLKLNVGDEFNAHAMRTWQLTNTQIDNYFMEPDFHYTVVDLNGNPSSGVIEIDNSNTTTSPWSQIKAVGNGTAIVLVTYDAIRCTAVNGWQSWMGGEYWGAIWPENTGVYIVTVGDNTEAINPNMIINEEYNNETQKLAGKYVDAEHDVFYYLDTEEGASYTFTPEGVVDITIAYPTIGEQTVTYSGFGSEGVTKNEDGSYTLLLKHGRQIVKLTDASGKSAYQILTAKVCHRDIINLTREGSNVFHPGDEIKIQYSGLFHPANKLAGIYNMSAYVTYNGVPNGTSLILGPNQYTFGSSDKAQAVTFEIPFDYDAKNNPEYIMNDGVIQVNGYGDPIGSHRNINPTIGRSPNFTATAHKTYFGFIPEVRLPIKALVNYTINIKCNANDAEITVIYKNRDLTLTPNANGEYTGWAGDYYVTASKAGFRAFRQHFTISEDAEGTQTFNIEMTEAPGAWDGKTMSEPQKVDDVYQISNGEELAWFANYINTQVRNQDAVMTDTIDLGDYDWTPIARNIEYRGNFNGQGYEVKGLYINEPNSEYKGLFEYLQDGTISNLAVSGAVTARNYVGGIVGCVDNNGIVDKCVNHALITGSYGVGGVVGVAYNATAKVTNSYNTGKIVGSTNCGGVVGFNRSDEATIENIFNIGEIIAEEAGACVGGPNPKTNITNAFCIKEYAITEGQTLVTEEQMRSGEVAYLLGEAFGQEIGVDEYPVIGGMKVLYDETTDTYYNDKGTSGIENVIVNGNNAAVYYNLNGVASDKPFKGINIIKLGDGSVKKIWF
ncbi:MAG: hypothetical protein K2J10_11165 [Muribaculaceae bacterium]|nr:hypothetical protein [Muribaculaceae bacterium]